MIRKVLIAAVSLSVVFGTGTAFALSNGVTQQAGNAPTVTVEDVQADSIVLEDVEVTGMQIPLESVDEVENVTEDDAETTDGAENETGVEDATNETTEALFGQHVEGFDVGSMSVEGVSNVSVEMQNGELVLSAQIDRLALENVSADRIQFSLPGNATDAAEMSGPIGVMNGLLAEKNVTYDAISVEGLSIGNLTISDVGPTTDSPTPTETAGNETATPTETATPANETSPAETETETEAAA